MLREACRLQEALAAFAANPTCDRQQRQSAEADFGIATGLIEDARVAVSSNDLATARAALLTALSLDAANAEATALLNSLGSPPISPSDTVSPFVIADNMLDAGFEDEAKEVVTDAMKKGGVIPPEYSRELDGRDSAGQWLLRHWQSLLGMVAAIVAGVAVIAGVIRALRWNRVPTLVFGSGFGDDAAALATMTRARMHRLCDVGSQPLRLSGEPPSAVSMPNLAEIAPTLKIFDALLANIIRPRFTTVATSVTANDTDKLARVGLVEFRHDKSPSSTTWRVREMGGNAAELTAASSFGAGWLLATARARYRKLRRRANSPLPTDDADSFGLLLAGNDAFRAGARDEARQYFAEALERDPANLSALHNSLVAIGSSGQPNDIRFALKKLKWLV